MSEAFGFVVGLVIGVILIVGGVNIICWYDEYKSVLKYKISKVFKRCKYGKRI